MQIKVRETLKLLLTDKARVVQRVSNYSKTTMHYHVLIASTIGSMGTCIAADNGHLEHA